MYISNTKVLAIPYSIIIYVLVFAGLLTYSAKMVANMMQKMNFKTPAKYSIPLLQQTKNTVPSVVELFTSEGSSS